jgi:hypothetical protein
VQRSAAIGLLVAVSVSLPSSTRLVFAAVENAGHTGVAAFDRAAMGAAFSAVTCTWLVTFHHHYQDKAGRVLHPTRPPSLAVQVPCVRATFWRTPGSRRIKQGGPAA